MSLVSGGSIAPLLQGLDRQYVYIAGTAIMVCMLVAAVLVMSSQKKEKVDPNSGIFSYLKFFYATFLKPHEKGDGQQDALESFYKAQVCARFCAFICGELLLTELVSRLVFMMPPESGYFAVVKTCWV